MPTQKKSSGFTLIELMVVVAIISILASVGIAVYSGAQKKARDSKRQQEIIEIQKAIEQYYAIKSIYPDNIYDAAQINNAEYFAKGTTPVDPKSSSNYDFAKCPPPANKYKLCAKLEILDSGTSDAIPSDGCESAYSTTGGSKDYFCVNALQ